MKIHFSDNPLSLGAFWNPPPCWRWWKHWSTSVPSRGGATCHHAARSRAPSSACPVPLPAEERCNLYSYIAALSTSSGPKRVPHQCCVDVPGELLQKQFCCLTAAEPSLLCFSTWRLKTKLSE